MCQKPDNGMELLPGRQAQEMVSLKRGLDFEPQNSLKGVRWSSKGVASMRGRRGFLQRLAAAGSGLASGWGCADSRQAEPELVRMAHPTSAGERPVTLFLCGDVMTGRGVDQVLSHPSGPRIDEGYVKSALDYVALAERRNGPIPKPVRFPYIWGDALEDLDRAAPDARVINLETSITTSDSMEPKGINYRMHPANVPCLTAARIDCCVLANNHVLDWGRAGLLETLRTLREAKVQSAGAGGNLEEALRPAVMPARDRARVLVFGIGGPDCGIPPEWAATETRPGVAFVPDFSEHTAHLVARSILAAKRAEDIVVLSIHWGGNWGYWVPPQHRAFARRVIDEGAVDVVHGHSSHHPKGIEVYQNKPILYGCGDFLNDYEGIGGYEEFRGELVLMYFPAIDPRTRELARLEMKALEVRRFRLHRAPQQSVEWLRDRLSREGRRLGTRLTLQPDGALMLEWS